MIAYVNGVPVARGERSYDKIREQFMPRARQLRDEIRAARGSHGGSTKSLEPSGDGAKVEG